jgi:Putative metallopeptidase
MTLISSPAFRLTLAVGAAWIAMAYTPAMASDAQPNRIRIEYVPPINPAHQPLFELLKQHQTLEKLQQVFSPLRLPVALTLRTIGCNGISNAWYHRPDVSVCYEYLNEIYQMMPKAATAGGITPRDAVLGQTFYVFGHEMGHAIFDVLKVPIFGDAENGADHFSAYMMLQFGKARAKDLITGAAYTYKKYVQAPDVSAPLAAFSDIHGAPAQRFYNMLCLAYGADPVLFAEFVAKETVEYLPKGRARNCKREYEQVTFAFNKSIRPHIDERLEKQVLDRTWLPDVKEPPPPEDNLQAGSRALQ